MNLKAHTIFVTTLLMCLLSSCTAEQIYRDVQQSHVRECRQLPLPQQSHCLSLNDVSWQEYQRERERNQRLADSNF
jgi:hypothetical protein